MIVGRFIGWLLVAAALVVVGRDLFAWWDRGAYAAIPTQDLWLQLHPESHAGLQPTIERLTAGFYPGAWADLFVPALAAPAWVVLLVPGLLFLLLFRRRSRRSYY